jgi:hypothetical protein
LAQTRDGFVDIPLKFDRVVKGAACRKITLDEPSKRASRFDAGLGFLGTRSGFGFELLGGRPGVIAPESWPQPACSRVAAPFSCSAKRRRRFSGGGLKPFHAGLPEAGCLPPLADAEGRDAAFQRTQGVHPGFPAQRFLAFSQASAAGRGEALPAFVPEECPDRSEGGDGLVGVYRLEFHRLPASVDQGFFGLPAS